MCDVVGTTAFLARADLLDSTAGAYRPATQARVSTALMDWTACSMRSSSNAVSSLPSCGVLGMRSSRRAASLDSLGLWAAPVEKFLSRSVTHCTGKHPCSLIHTHICESCVNVPASALCVVREKLQSKRPCLTPCALVRQTEWTHTNHCRADDPSLLLNFLLVNFHSCMLGGSSLHGVRKSQQTTAVCLTNARLG